MLNLGTHYKSQLSETGVGGGKETKGLENDCKYD